MSVIAKIMLLTIGIAQWTNWRFLFNVAVHFLFTKKFVFSQVQNFFAGLVNVVNIYENANGNENRQYYQSNNNVIHGSPRRHFFHKTNVVRLEKGELSSCFKFIQHNPRHEAQSEDPCDHAYKNNVSPINCNVKETQ